MPGNPQDRVWAAIDLAALERNLGRIRSALPPHVRYVAVVKADAYGHGLYQTVARLMQCHADAFAVANVFEGAEVREVGAGWPILVLGAVLPGEEDHLVNYDLIATVSGEEEVKRFEKAARRAGQALRVHLKIDTGMGRLGVWHSDAEALFKRLEKSKHLVLEGIFTHFSSADSDLDYTRTQRDRLLRFIKKIPVETQRDLLVHADNSAGLESFTKDSPLNAVRVGLLQFGLLPYPTSLLSRLAVEPVLSFSTRVGLTKELPSGTPISYGQTYRLKQRSRIAVLTAGYGDGIPTASSNKAEVLIMGKRCPVLGRITMDQTVVDVTHIEHPVSPGDIATLIGRQGREEITVTEFSEWGNCIPWETFCSLTKRVPRVYQTSRVHT
ncbi:alanine racemase [Rubellicoccus peritrichatus]|uniref:Alanine racemase n=1 Tax=Rubellicoccus peritrichatus TaxID=3080537 RepID=A0AAQ3QQ46_9BACT|nr:alanine racemase [Puniceicoccus sp. CR14]WOO39833.1 alanine racemase [Puniceicoccus sp. CR14]